MWQLSGSVHIHRKQLLIQTSRYLITRESSDHKAQPYKDIQKILGSLVSTKRSQKPNLINTALAVCVCVCVCVCATQSSPRTRLIPPSSYLLTLGW